MARNTHITSLTHGRVHPPIGTNLTTLPSAKTLHASHVSVGLASSSPSRERYILKTSNKI